MICDKCHEDTGGFEVRAADGRVLCHECAKEEKRPSKPKADSFTKLARRLMRVSRTSREFTDVIAIKGGKRCYTNAHVLISEVDAVDVRPEAVDVKTLEPAEVTYPNIENVLRKRPSGERVVEIPEEFYRYLDAFDGKKLGNTLVKISPEGIHARDQNHTAEMSLNYGEADVSKVRITVVFDGAYLAILKPKRILVGETGTDLCVFEECYAKGLSEAKHVVAMPMEE